MRQICLLALGSMTLFLNPSPAEALGIRHDRVEADHLRLADRFPNVGSVSGLGTATLIHPSWVLTGAHVGELLPRMLPEGTPLTVAFGDETYTVEEVVYPTGRVPLDPATMGRDEAEDENAHDIALFRLDRSVEGVQPARLYHGSDELGVAVVLVGCGALMADGSTGATMMESLGMPRGTRRAGTNRIESLAMDGRLLVATFDAPDQALELEATAFAGDSGGPAFIEVADGEWEVAGVLAQVDTGDDDRVGNYGDIIELTRVSWYVNWIHETLAEPGGK